MMKVEEVMTKANAGEELTEEEVRVYQENVVPVKQVYGKYGTLAKVYLEEHNKGKLWSLGELLPEYLHHVDEQADALYEILLEKFSSNAKYRRTDDYLEDVRRMNEMKNSIEEEILNELVHVG